jgi:hypothetical protein
VDAGDAAAVVVAVASVIAVAVLVAAAVSLMKAAGELRRTAEQLRQEAVPLMTDLRQTVASAGAELERVDTLLGTAENVTATVDSASRLAYLAFSNPVIKALAFASGTGRAARRFRRVRS